MVALEYAQRHPKRLRSLVLSHTAPPSAEFGALCQRYAGRVVHSAVKGGEKEKKEDLPSAISRALMGHRVHSKDLARDVPAMINVEGMVHKTTALAKKFHAKQRRAFQML